MSSKQATAQIDLDAILHNFNRAKELAPASQVMAVIKADAYGHGAIKVANKLKAANSFGVARISEAVKLRESGISQPICLLEGVMNKEELNLASIYELQVVVHSDYQLDLMHRASARRLVWLKIDTGMGRLGISVKNTAAAIEKLGHQTLLGLMTHLSHANGPDSGPTNEQITKISSLSSELKRIEPAAGVLTIANSAGVLMHPMSHLDLIRPGLMLYGASPFDDLEPINELHPAMTFSGPIISVRTVSQGESIGYGGLWTAAEDTRVAVIATGYADGYPRETKQGTPVLIHGQKRCLIGRVSMDMICVQLEADDSARPGDRAVLWGEGLPVEEIAKCADTVAYTLLTGVSARVTRTYRGEVRG